MKRMCLSLCLAVSIGTLITGCNGKSGSSPSNVTSSGTAMGAQPQKVETLSIDTVEQNAANTKVADEVCIALGYDLSDLAPWSSATAGRNTVLPLLYEYMAYYDPHSPTGIAGILMDSYERVDGLTARFTVRDNVYDSAGNHLTADDVAFCFNQWKQNGKSVKCKLLESATAIDPYTVELKLTKDTVGDVENMLCGLVPIVTRAAFEASTDGMVEHVVSTAPYKIGEFISGSHLTLVKRDDYWQTDDSQKQKVQYANAKKITYKIITESFQVPINLETNTIDITSQMNLKDAARFNEGGESAKGYKVYGIKDTNFYWMTFNCDPNVGAFTGNQKLRQAIAYAVDKQGLVVGVLSGGGEKVHAYATDICVDYQPQWNEENYYDYDVVKAKQLVTESGFDTSKSLRIMCPNATIAKNTAQIVQSYLLQIGLKSEILSYDSALFQTYKTEPTQWDIMIDSKMSNDYVTSLASTFEVSGKARALNFVDDPKLQDMVTNVVTSAGHTTENVNEYMEYLKDQAYVIGLFVPYQYYAVEDTILGIFTNFKSYLLPNACTYSTAFVR